MTVYEEAGLTPEEVEAMPRYLAGVDEFYGTPAFNKLYEYFAFGVCEMPTMWLRREHNVQMNGFWTG